MSHYDCRCCDAPNGISHEHCSECQAGRCDRTPQAAQDVLAERQRQKDVEGWTPGHDDEHQRGELALAAACYAASGSGGVHAIIERSPWWDIWPWDLLWWKSKDRRSDLVRAAALLIAEIERLDRAARTPDTSDDR